MSHAKAILVDSVTVIDPDSDAPVEVELYKDQVSGGIFGVDSSYVVTLEDDEPVFSPFDGIPVLIVEGEAGQDSDVVDEPDGSSSTKEKKQEMRLRDWLPGDAEISDKVKNLLNVQVTACYGFDHKADPWPGQHKNVMNWCVLATGHAVGWNENPSRGWSFPVIKHF